MVRMLPSSLLALFASARSGTPTPPAMDVFYGPDQYLRGDPNFIKMFSSPDQSWPELAANTQWIKVFLDGLRPTLSDEELKAMISTIKAKKFKTAIEIGGARWGKGGCNASSVLYYAAGEQKLVSRWLHLGGQIDLVSTDHANTWNIRRVDCVPAVPMATRIDAVAQVFASWRTFLGPAASLGFIESLGYWEIGGLDGTNFTNTDPAALNHLAGWIPRLDDFTRLLLKAAERHNPTPSVPLLDHYQIDFGLEGVEYDTSRYGRAQNGGFNYGRILGAEGVMQKHGLQSMVIMNAFHGKPGHSCVVSCDEADASHSAVVRTLNFTGGYLLLPERLSKNAVIQQWQPYPNLTGPETDADTGMWMASHAAKLVKAASRRQGKSLVV